MMIYAVRHIRGKHVSIVPHNNKYVFHYDVNSLYPTAMKNFVYPNKIYAKFIGDIRTVNEFKGLYDSMLGIYRVKENAPCRTALG